MADTRQAKANKGNRIAAGVLVIIVSLFCFLSLVGALGGVGRMVYSFLCGFFGLAAYAYSLMGLIIGIAVTFNVRPKMRLSKALTYFGLLILGIFALQIYTSSTHIVGANYAEYLLACYNNTNTAGGMLLGVPAYPLMKVITSVGALIAACVAFFILAFFAIYPSIKRNVTYTVATKGERDKKLKAPKQKRSFFSKKEKQTAQTSPLVEAQSAPTITDFNTAGTGRGLYVVDVPGDPLQQKVNKKALGAEGYSPLDSFNPLYPNAQGTVEDDVKRPVKPVGADKFSARNIARDILFGSGPSNDNLARFDTVKDPNNALSSVSAPYSAVRRNELKSKLGVDATQSAIREDFMSRYRAVQPEPQSTTSQTSQTSEKASATSKIQTPLDFKRDFSALKQEQTQRFGQMYAKPEFEAGVHMEQQDEACLIAEPVKKEVVKPTKTYDGAEAINSTIQKANDSVAKQQVNVGMLGALNRAISGEEEQKPVVKEEIVSEAYEKPKTDMVFIAREKGENTQNTAQPTTQKTVENNVVAPSQPAKSAQTAQTPVVAPKKAASIDELDRSGYKPVQGEAKLPRAFAQTAVEEEKTETNFFGGIGKTKPVKTYETSKATLENQRPKYVDEDKTVGGDNPSAPAPVQQKVTGGDMSRAAIQSTTAIAKNSAKDIENAEVKARIQNIKQAIKETPQVGQYEREALMREEKMKASQSRGIQKDETPKKNDARLTQVNMDQAISQASPKRPYVAPPISLLNPPAPEIDQNEDYEQKKEQIINTLAFFSITGEVIDIMVGPTFTMYKLRVEMPRGRTIGYISSLESDIAMKMEAGSVRIIAPIPGENAVGIEVPNKHRRNVNLSEIIQSPEFNNAKAPATFALGKNLYGQSRVVEIKKLPHVLIAGATGAGKSCCINSIIVSLLYKASPDDVRLILIDPKRIEMSVYAGIPHLLMDEIICDTDKAIRALNWAISEMERRIKFLADVNYRDIDEYNADCQKNGYEKMPRIVIIVDEFADLMSTGKKAVEDTVNRIARLARAVGIHLMLATQRPSVDVISGTIKNNFPSRVAFKVTSSFDSKTILDTVGADKLLGYGDLLYMMPGASDLERMQGAFISNEEVKKVVDFVKAKNDAYFDNNIKDAIFKDKEEEKPAQSKDAREGNKDKIPPELFDALQLGIELREEQDAPISISFMQRRLGLGWPKAAKIYDKMDLMGYLTPDEHDPKKKKVNITYEELEELKATVQSEDEE
ncbi:cell division protein FtsK/SpoIIIE [Firmicutes bacterium CAG:475]|nr:cell division protein FtsK/SpoIIIE [Firmicutes bacterium CAG:475]